MTTDNLTAILHAVNDIRLEQTPIEEPNDNEVLLKMACVGICGSDVHYLVHGRIDNFILQKPMIIGHESSGVVFKLGKNVKHLKIGDRVAVEPGIPCRICSYCKEGRYNLCKEMVFCATPPHHGSLRRFYKHPADFCFKLPDNVSLEEGALLEPLSVAVHACKRANIGLGSNVLITGAGPIGLVILLVAKAMGASKIVITDIVQKRLTLAKELGATATFLIKPENAEQNAIKQIHNLFGCEPNKGIDASGAEASIRLLIRVTRPGGVIILVGCSKPEVNVPLITAATKEVGIIGVFRYCNDYPDALDLVATGKINNLKQLITHNFTIEETVKAFDTAKSPMSGSIKIMIHCK